MKPTLQSKKLVQAARCALDRGDLEAAADYFALSLRYGPPTRRDGAGPSRPRRFKAQLHLVPQVQS